MIPPQVFSAHSYLSEINSNWDTNGKQVKMQIREQKKQLGKGQVQRSGLVNQVAQRLGGVTSGDNLVTAEGRREWKVTAGTCGQE